MFLQQALDGNGGVFNPYDGYLHLVPRIIAGLTVAAIPPSGYAMSMNLLSCLTVALVAALVFHCSRELDERLHTRIALASLVLLISSGPLETTGNTANLHWYLLFATPWLLFKRPGSRGEALILLLAGAAISLTEILSVIFVPLALVRHRDKAFWPARVGLLLGLLCQLCATSLNPRVTNESEPLELGSTVTGWFVNAVGTPILGETSHIGALVNGYGWLPLAASAALFVAAFALVMRMGTPQHRLAAVVVLGASITLWAATQIVNPTPLLDYANFTSADWAEARHSRYAVPTSMFVMALVPLAMSVLPKQRVVAGTVLLAVFFSVQALTLLPSETARSGGPDWSEATESAVGKCHRGAQEVVLPAAPKGWASGGVRIPCEKLR
ncbi:hypothetical protein [Arthrobacter sp. NPDC092385]|uniref:hypothetical protein n=1 Tax=Arthrobacter sp. NPDC092385 TaxID=3363943 RepID=UPI0037FE4B3D